MLYLIYPRRRFRFKSVIAEIFSEKDAEEESI
jgi:hypothetical protein